jgi:hypothetical protein
MTPVAEYVAAFANVVAALEAQIAALTARVEALEAPEAPCIPRRRSEMTHDERAEFVNCHGINAYLAIPR